MKYNETQQQFVRTLTEEFDHRNVRYVVPRGHKELPESVPGSDLDILVAPESFKQATAAARSVGLDSQESVMENTWNIVQRGLEQPRDAATLVLGSPSEVVPYIRRAVSPRRPNQRGLVNRHFGVGDLDIHLTNHLAYSSTMNGSKIRIDPAVETAMFERRVKRDGLYIPAEPDELAHLVCRGVFDYEGKFPNYYASRCDHLVETVKADDTARSQFKDLLAAVFFAADSLVYDLVVNSAYNEIRQALYRFSDY